MLGARDHLLDPIDDVEGRGFRALHGDEDDGLFALHQHRVLLHPAHEAHRGDVAQVDECVAFPLDRELGKVLNLQRRRVCHDDPVGLLDLDVAGRQYEVLLHERGVNVRRSELTGEQFLLIEVNHDLHVLPAVWVRQNDPRHRHEQGADSHIGEIIELRGRQVVGADFEHGHRYGGWRETHDHGRRNIRRQRLDDILRYAHDICFCPAHVDSVLKKNIGDAAAKVGMAMDVLDAFHRRGQETFEQIRDAPFHLLRQHAGVDPDHGGDGNRDIRKNVGRHVAHSIDP